MELMGPKSNSSPADNSPLKFVRRQAEGEEQVSVFRCPSTIANILFPGTHMIYLNVAPDRLQNAFTSTRIPASFQ